MCGISGIISKSGIPNKENIITMNGLISHRGPDQSGYLEYKNLLLGQVRLSVLDGTEKGRQPMSSDGRYWIIFNGEVYNYRELKKRLIEKNYKFYSETDTEVVLNSYIEWGDECFQKFNGDWVIAILDKKTNEIVIARDGIGCKPCYIYEDMNIFAFSSEIKGLYGACPDIRLDNDNLGISPFTLFSCSKTFFKNVTQLPPGRLIKINLETKKQAKQRWNHPLEDLPSIHPSYTVNQGEYFELLYNATKTRLDADLKIGTSLSGGIDSSVIFAILNLIQNNETLVDEKKIDLNPIIMNYEGCKTAEDAIKISNKYKRDYKIFEFKESNIKHIVDLLVKLEAVEEFNMQPLLYENQKKIGIDISIDGHGADEFLGLPNFLGDLSTEFFNNITSMRNTINVFGKSKSKESFNSLFGNIGENVNHELVFNPSLKIKNIFQNYTRASKFNPENVLLQDDKEILKEFDLSTQYTYMIGYCGWMQYFLSKWDRASMSSAVEVRSPFLDPNVIKYSLALPLNKKIKNGYTKSILRDSMSPFLPPSITNQQFKQGLPRQKFNFNDKVNYKYLNNILNQKNFKESNLWDGKLILKDFNEHKNLDSIWSLAKHFLMSEGIKEKQKDVFKNYNKEFYSPNNLVTD